MHLSIASLLCLLTFAGPAAAQSAPAPAPAAAPNPRVALETTKGKIVIELFADKAPKTVKNFLDYVKAGHYNGTIFHRVIADFMVQGGGFTPDMTEKPTRAPVQNEADNRVLNQRGTVAMARTPDPHSARGQFFINLKNNGFLNHTAKTSQGWGYTVFGQVVEGMEVVDSIATVQTTTKGTYGDVPVQPILIQKATVVPAPKPAAKK